MRHTYIRAGLLALLAATGCGGLLPKPAPPPDVYSLDTGAAEPLPATALPAPGAAPRPTLIVDLPVADAGFDSLHIVYLRSDGRPEHFAHSDWVATPALMLLPLIVRQLAADPAFRAVVAAPSAATANLRLETELVRLQQEFGTVPSRVRLALRAYILREASGEVIASATFEAAQNADSDSPEGGARAAGAAVRTVLAELATFSARVAVAPPSPTPIAAR
jgi:cholesterol transport system auxiliary component